MSKTPSTAPSAFKRSSSLQTTLAYMGSNMSLFAKGEETGGRFALMEFHSRPGNEPPPHVHEWEHELFYVLEGRMEFYCDGKIMNIGPGEDRLLAPRQSARILRSIIYGAYPDFSAGDGRTRSRPGPLFHRYEQTGGEHGIA